MNALFRPLLAIAILCAAAPALAQDAAIAPGAAYRDLRAGLISKGWRPDVKYGLKTGDGKALYRFPEIVCGPQLCNAKWRDRSGEEQTIRLLRGYGQEDHRVAPQ